MPYYILSGKSSRNDTDTELIRADSTRSALELFSEKGYTDVVLHTDDASAATIDPATFKDGFTPKMWVDRFYERKSVWSNFRLLIGLWISKWGRWSILFAPLDYFLLFSIFGFDTSKMYQRLMDASSWARAEEMLKIIPKLRHKLGHDRTLQSEIDFRESIAWSMLGRLDKALNIIKTQESEIPNWMYYSRLSSIYLWAGKKEECLASAEKMAELAPENAVCLLDLSLAHVRQRSDIPRARALFQQAMQMPIGENLRPFMKMQDGMITFEEGNVELAAALLEEAVKTLNPLVGASPLIGQLRDRTLAYLALALNAAKRRGESLEKFRLAERRVTKVATLHDLRDRCLKELKCQPSQF